MKRLLCLLMLMAMPALAQERPLVDATPWTASGTDSVKVSVAQVNGGARLDYDITGAGYAVLSHPLGFNAPANFVIDVPLSGEGAGNTLEIKFVDTSGESVWWVRKPTFDGKPTVLHIRPRHISFAWGPVQDKTFRGGAKLEIVVVKSEKGPSTGSLSVGPITWHEEAPPPATEAPLRSDRAAIVDGNAATVWTAAPGDAGIIDLGRVREFGGVKLDWLGAAPAFRLALSDDGKTWRETPPRANDAAIDLVPLGETDARFIRIVPAQKAVLAEASLMPLIEGTDRNALLKHAAELAPRGAYPRAYLGEQPYWTVIGVPGGGPRSSLLSEDGAVELGPEGASLEPALRVGGKTITWADAAISQGLKDDLPLPFVQWKAPGVRMKVHAAAFGDAANPYAVVRYEVTNTRRKAQTIDLDLAIRPIQVNPPTQFLTRPGGVSPIHDIDLRNGVAMINGQAALFPLDVPTRISAGRLLGQSGTARALHDADGLATGTYGYSLKLKRGETRTISFVYPLSEQRSKPVVPTQASIEAGWRKTLSTTRLTMPKGTPPIADSLNLSLAYILMLRDHDLLKPGARSYDRSWIRDGAMMSEGLMRMGHFAEARAYFETYSSYLFDTGKVPCCVDGRGADPLPENDSHGEFAWLAGELVRYGLPPDAAKTYWPKVRAALAYQEQMRQSTRIPANQTPGTQNYYGLMPPSISHEGYFDKAAYSYWDDFWALKGYRGGQVVARAVGDAEALGQLEHQGTEFAAELKSSLVATAKRHNIDILAGSADRGDYDPTSSTLGLTAGAHADDVPADLARNTWDAYWKQINDRQTTPKSYVPYELRNVAVYLRLKQPARARTALDFQFKDQALPAWHEWAEVVAVPRRNPTFVGDLPHGWVESDYMRSALDLFAYERPEKGQMVLLAGFDPKWAGLGETRLERLHTPYGQVSLRVTQAGQALRLQIDATAVPPGGFIVDASTLMGPAATATIDGKPVALTDGEARITTPKADIRISGGAK